MVSANTKYLATLPALGKLVTILFSIISIGLGGHAYEKSLFNMVRKIASAFPVTDDDLRGVPTLQRETFFLSIVSVFLILSVISLLCHVLNEELSYTKTSKMVDIGIHILGALMLIIAGSLFIASANSINDLCKGIPELIQFGLKCQYKGEKIAGGVFTILNSFVFGFVAFIGILRIKNDEVVSSAP